MTLKLYLALLIFAVSLAGCDVGTDDIRQATIMAANIELVEKADTGDIEALERLVACLENADPYSDQKMETYYWLIRLQAAGARDFSTKISLLENQLTEDEKYSIDTWLQEFPDTPLIPWVTKINCFPEKF